MKKQKGFTILEISIVLVVIGILTGGIIAGQALIRSAKISKLMSTMKQYEISVSNFKRVYGYYPGDIPNGPQLFPECPHFYGSGNGFVGYAYAPIRDDNWYTASEPYSAMPQLSYAKMTQEKLTCTGMANGYASDIDHDNWRGRNLPAIADEGVLFLESSHGLTRLNSEFYGHRPWPYCRVALRAATRTPGFSVNNGFIGPYLTVADAKALDLKADDGDAVAGRWLFANSYDASWHSCIDNGDLGTADRPGRKFNETLKEKACQIYYCLDESLAK